MNKLSYIIFLIANICVLVSCSSRTSNAESIYPKYPKSVEKEKKQNQKTPDESIIDSISAFANESSSKVLTGSSGNICYSPVSMYFVLSILANGANSDTELEILDALKVDNSDKTYLARQMKMLYELLYFDNSIGSLKIANSLWLQDDYIFKKSFIKNVTDNYYTSLHRVDFGNIITKDLVGQWVSENTNGFYESSFHFDPDTDLSIVNVLYLNEKWLDPFIERGTNATVQDKFYVSKDEEVLCEFIKAIRHECNYADEEGFRLSSLKLVSGGHMTFVLPKEGISIDELVSSPEKINSFVNPSNNESKTISYKLPKFGYDYTKDLIPTLNGMGVMNAFNDDAQFTDMTDGSIYISEISQSMRIAIDERGVEAGSITRAMGVISIGVPETEPIEMNLNKPFIYYITSPDNILLFIGIVDNPNES